MLEIDKKVLKKILYDRVPKELMERKKTGFSIPIYEWLKKGEVREWAESVIKIASSDSQSIVDRARV